MAALKVIPAKIRLEKSLVGLANFSWLLNLMDQYFNIPRLLDRVYLTRIFNQRYRRGLDIGAGKGSLTGFLLNYVDDLVCLDKEAKEMAILKKRFKNQLGRLSLITADARRLPFKSESFDLIFCNCVLEHVKQDQKVLAEIARCLRPKGSLILALPNQVMTAGWFKSLLLRHPGLRFLADASLKKYFSFTSPKEAEEWYSGYRWQHVRRGYRLEKIKEQLHALGLTVQSSIYFPSRLISEAWEIITFSRLNYFFPYSLLFFAPLFWLLPKGQGTQTNSLELALLARKGTVYSKDQEAEIEKRLEDLGYL